MGKHMLIKHVATLGPEVSLGDSLEVRCLNRNIQWVWPGSYYSGTAYSQAYSQASSMPGTTTTKMERIEYKADHWHAEILMQQFGLNSKSK
eukprot:3419772-Karenia_brevis.AAC.1